VNILDKYGTTKKNSHAGTTFLGVSFNPDSLPIGIFRSLASMIGINHAKTKLCPFCEETIKEKARTCGFCNRILMKQINFKVPE